MKSKHILILLIALFMSISLYAHCEIPCGIYGDRERTDMIREHVLTIEKSMTMIDKLSKEKKPDYNQLVRWVNNKDEHANAIQNIVTQYFMFQRVKPVHEEDPAALKKYAMQLEYLHKIAINAMKAKQTTNKDYPQAILLNLHQFEHVYFDDHEH